MPIRMGLIGSTGISRDPSILSFRTITHRRDVNLAVLLADAIVRAADRDGAGAAQSANALINMAHYLRDEPVLISQLVRAVIRRQAVNALERALTCAQSAPMMPWRLVQQNLEAEVATSGLRIALRGERGSMSQWAASVANGDASWGRLNVTDDEVA